VLFVGRHCYVANVGDCRAVLCHGVLRSHLALTTDHKPCLLSEQRRIREAGGEVGSRQRGPVRVYPGGLSLSRSIGDLTAKVEEFGGNPGVVVCDPEVVSFEVDPVDHLYLTLCSDGVLDRLSSREVARLGWSWQDSPHLFCKTAAEAIVSAALEAQTLDNVSAIVIGLPGLGNCRRTSVR
jgi:protein phosphatase 2C family protein 2/3